MHSRAADRCRAPPASRRYRPLPHPPRPSLEETRPQRSQPYARAVGQAAPRSKLPRFRKASRTPVAIAAPARPPPRHWSRAIHARRPAQPAPPVLAPSLPQRPYVLRLHCTPRSATLSRTPPSVDVTPLSDAADVETPYASSRAKNSRERPSAADVPQGRIVPAPRHTAADRLLRRRVAVSGACPSCDGPSCDGPSCVACPSSWPCWHSATRCRP